MRRIRSKDTAPEIIVRRLVFAMGFRYRLHQRDLPGRPDIVLARHRKIVLVHGCFWHQHARKACPIARAPKSNQGYWRAKLAGNVARDESNARLLRAAGWKVLTVWECETRSPARLFARLTRFLGRHN
jgi:DNA mismatch endonuclease (patch repair protein)